MQPTPAKELTLEIMQKADAILRKSETNFRSNGRFVIFSGAVFTTFEVTGRDCLIGPVPFDEWKNLGFPEIITEDEVIRLLNNMWSGPSR